MDETYLYFTNVLAKEKESEPNESLGTIKAILISKMNELELIIMNCTSIDALNTAKKHLQAAITVIKAIEQTKSVKTLPVKRKVSPNQNCEHQESSKFFSTKKKRLSLTQTMSRPSSCEMNKLKHELKEQETIFCGSCLKEDDRSNHEVMEWIQCERCALWIHLTCTIPKLTNAPDVYICHFCTSM